MTVSLRADGEVAHIGLAHLMLKTWRLKPRTPDYEDALQVCRLAIAKAEAKFQPGRGIKFSTYATRCIRNALIAWAEGHRRHGYRNVVGLVVTPPLSLDQLLTNAGDPVAFADRRTDGAAAAAEAAETGFRVRRELARLADFQPRQALFVYLHCCDGMSLRVIGAEHGLSPERVRQVVRDGLVRLRRRLAARGVGA